MKSSRINYVLVGGFVIAMVAGLVVVLALIAGRTGPTDTYRATYGNVGGVKRGTQVFFEGYPVGTVKDVSPAPPGTEADGAARFRVTMALQKGWRIPEGSVARITSTGLLAEVAIEISSGAGPDAVPPGGTIAGAGGSNVYAALADAAQAVTRLSEDSLQPLLAKLTVYVDRFGTTLTQDTPEILANLRRFSDELATAAPQITAHLAAATEKLDRRVLSDGNIAAINRTIANGEAASERLVTLGDNLAQASDAVARMTDRVDSLVAGSTGDIRDSAKDLRYTLDAVARQIDSIMYNMDTASRNMSEFSREIRRNPSVLLGRQPPREHGPLGEVR